MITGTGQLDLTDGRAAIDYTGSAGTAITQIKSLLVAGYNAGSWNGPGGIVSSTATASSSSDQTSLGYAEASDVLAAPIPALFGGVKVDASSVLVRYTYAGDADLNGSSIPLTSIVSSQAMEH